MKSPATIRSKKQILTSSYLDHETILRLEFFSYYSLVRRRNATYGSIILGIISIASAVFRFVEHESIIGVLLLLILVSCSVVIFFSFKPAKIKKTFDTSTSAVIIIASSIAVCEVAVNSQSHDLFVIEVLMALCVFFGMRTYHTLTMAEFCFLPLFVAAIVHKYNHHDDIMLTVVNFSLYVAIAGAAAMAVMTHEKMEFARYKDQLKVHRAQTVLEMQQARSAALLENLFPPRIRSFVEAHDAQAFNEASVVFADLENFQELSAALPPKDYITLLNQVFACLDELTEKHGLLKVKTTGEVYMAVSSIPTEDPRGTLNAVAFALDGLEALRAIANRSGFPLRPRFGVNTGFVVAGTLHTSKLTFDIYGDAVNVAHRMMYHGVPGAVQISDNTLKLLPAAVRQQAGPLEEAVVISERLTARTIGTYDSERSGLESTHSNILDDSVHVQERPCALEDAEAQAMCRGWVLHPRGEIALKNRGSMRAFLVSKAGELDALPGETAAPPMREAEHTALVPASVLSRNDGECEVPFGAVLQAPQPPSEGRSSLHNSRSFLSASDTQPVPSFSDEPRTPDSVAMLSKAPQPLKTFSLGGISVSASVLSSPTGTGPMQAFDRPGPPSVAASRISRKTTQSSSQGTSSLEDVLNQVVDHCDDSSDVFAELRQNALESMGEGEKASSKRESNPPAPISPEEMEANVRSFGPQMKWMWVFKDATVWQRYFNKSLDNKRMACMLIYAYALLMNLAFCILEAILLPEARNALLCVNFAFLGVSLLHFGIFLINKIPFRGLGFVNMVWMAIWGGSLIGQLVITLVCTPSFRPLQKRVFDLLYAGRLAFFWLICSFAWCPMLSHGYKIVVSFASYIAVISIYAAMGQFPCYNLSIMLAAILIEITVASVIYAVNTRLGFLQGDWMRRAMTEVKEKSHKINMILESSLPGPVLERLKRSPKAVSQSIPSASIFFADFVGFTQFCSAVPSLFVVQLLDEVYARFDQICKMHSCSQIALVGDCYFAGAGVLGQDDAHMLHAVRAAAEILQELRRYNKEKGTSLALRIGLSTGPVFAGVLGVTRFTYDVWGPAVIDAKRIEGASQPNRILVAHAIKEALAPAFRFRSGPRVNRHRTYFLSSSAPTAPDGEKKV